MINKSFKHNEDIEIVGFIWHYPFLILLMNESFRYDEDLNW